jgi:hypothetical protein
MHPYSAVPQQTPRHDARAQCRRRQARAVKKYEKELATWKAKRDDQSELVKLAKKLPWRR